MSTSRPAWRVWDGTVALHGQLCPSFRRAGAPMLVRKMGSSSWALVWRAWLAPSSSLSEASRCDSHDTQTRPAIARAPPIPAPAPAPAAAPMSPACCPRLFCPGHSPRGQRRSRGPRPHRRRGRFPPRPRFRHRAVVLSRAEGHVGFKQAQSQILLRRGVREVPGHLPSRGRPVPVRAQILGCCAPDQGLRYGCRVIAVKPWESVLCQVGTASMRERILRCPQPPA